MTTDLTNHFIGTNNSFVIEEVIKPFMKDIFGLEYEIDMDTNYSIKIDNFIDGINKIKLEGILCSYINPKKNFIFELARYIVIFAVKIF